MFSCCKILPLNAWTVIGTFCTLSERRWAVTTISSIPAPWALTTGVLASAAKAVPPRPLSTATAAHESI